MTEIFGAFVLALMAGGIERSNAWAEVRRGLDAGVPPVEAHEPLARVERNNIRLGWAWVLLLVAAVVAWCLGQTGVGETMVVLGSGAFGGACGLGGALEQIMPSSNKSR